MKAAIGILLAMTLSVVAQGMETNNRVLLLPFVGIGDEGNSNMAWIGQAVQQNLLAELSRGGEVQPMVPAVQPSAVSDTAGALKAGEQVKAAFVVFGSYQISEAGLRLTGQVLDVGKAQLIGGMKATGSLRDLFALEDTLAEQTKRILAKQLPPRVTKAVAPETPVVEASEPAQQEMPWQRDTDWIRRTQQRERYDEAYYRSRYWYTYGAAPGWYGYYSPYCYGYGRGPYYGTNGWAYQGGW